MTFSGLAQLTSTTNRQVWARPPIDVDFQVLMFTASGLIVRFLKVFEKSNYHSIKWVRYLTKASGSYQIRVSLYPPSRHPSLTAPVLSIYTPGLHSYRTGSLYLPIIHLFRQNSVRYSQMTRRGVTRPYL